ncbi:MAG: hypothetical protein HYS07_05765 [Chlamydiae bacterium]|nr:hypothetical protein [Chlamydiota bacterium]MBI3277933.1 hypothetical protein [Chlamydiota bacterium]
MKCENCIQFEKQLKSLKEKMELIQYELAQYKMERYPKKKDRDKDDKDSKTPPKRRVDYSGIDYDYDYGV